MLDVSESKMTELRGKVGTMDGNKQEQKERQSIPRRIKQWLTTLLEPLVTEIAPIFADYHEGLLADRDEIRRRRVNPHGDGGDDPTGSNGTTWTGDGVDFTLAA